MRSVLSLGIGIGFAVVLSAQGVDSKDLLHSPADSWLTYPGD